MKNDISKIEAKQRKSGGFSDSSGAESVFYTSLILLSLDQCKEAKTIKQKSADFLLSKKSKDWVFSHDVNINFCALSALTGYDKELINGEAIAKILTSLISVESKEGGPYYSYFGGIGKDSNKSVDLATNAGIAYFLHLEDVDLPSLNELVEFSIGKGDFKSNSYTSIFPTIYFISRFYKGGKKQKLIDFVLAEKGKGKYWGNPLNAFMAIIAFSNLGYPAKKLGEELGHLKNLSEEELRKHYPLGKDQFSTPELNTAFYLEALEKIGGQKAGEEIEMRRKPETVMLDREEGNIFDRILKIAAERFSVLPADMKLIALEETQATIKGNIDKQMSLMPFWFKKSLGKKADKISDDKIARLGLMNIFFWTAFIIYDDFWDEEGTPNILPTANLYARNFIEYFNEAFPRGSDFNLFFRKLMDGVDSGNTRILVNFRAKIAGNKVFVPENIPDYGDYEVVYQPSSAHVLGPVSMLCELDRKIDSPEVQNLVSYFKNYLIAMQINDDMYDWEEDLKRGHLSTVVVMLLKDFNNQKAEIDMERDLAELKKVFWLKTLPKACQVAMEHTQRSREALGKITILENPAPLEEIVNVIESVAKTALKEHKYTEDFLEAYKGQGV